MAEWSDSPPWEQQQSGWSDTPPWQQVPSPAEQAALTHGGTGQVTNYAQPQQGLLNKLGNRISNIGQEFMNHPSNRLGPDGKPIPEFGIPDPVHVLGQMAGGVEDIVGAGIKNAYNAIMPEQAKSTVNDFTSAAFAPETPIGGALSSAARGVGKIVQMLPPEGQKYAEDALNIAGAVPIVKGGISAFQGAKSLAKSTGEAITKAADETIANKPSAWLIQTEANYNKQLADIVDKGLSGGAKPKTIGKNNYSKMTSYEERGVSAIENIIKDKPDFVFDRGGKTVQGVVPRTGEEASQAIEHGIQKRLSEATQNAAQSGEQGVIVEGKSALDYLKKVATNTNITDAEISTAKELLDLIAKNPARTPTDIEELLSSLKGKTKSFYNSGGDESAKIAAKTTDLLRQDQVTAMGNAGPAWQKARNEVRDYMTIQKDVNKAWGVDKRKQAFGFFDMANMYSVGELTAAIAGANPVLLAKAGGIAGIKAYMKYRNQMNTKISSMFSDAEKVIGRRDKISKILKGLPQQGPPVPDPSYVRGENVKLLEGRRNFLDYDPAYSRGEQKLLTSPYKTQYQAEAAQQPTATLAVSDPSLAANPRGIFDPRTWRDTGKAPRIFEDTRSTRAINIVGKDRPSKLATTGTILDIKKPKTIEDILANYKKAGLSDEFLRMIIQ